MKVCKTCNARIPLRADGPHQIHQVKVGIAPEAYLCADANINGVGISIKPIMDDTGIPPVAFWNIGAKVCWKSGLDNPEISWSNEINLLNSFPIVFAYLDNILVKPFFAIKNLGDRRE